MTDQSVIQSRNSIEIGRQWRVGVPADQIAMKLGLDEGEVIAEAMRLGLAPRGSATPMPSKDRAPTQSLVRRKPFKRWDEAEFEEFDHRWRAGEAAKLIGARFNIGEQRVYQIAVDRELPRRKSGPKPLAKQRATAGDAAAVLLRHSARLNATSNYKHK